MGLSMTSEMSQPGGRPKPFSALYLIIVVLGTTS